MIRTIANVIRGEGFVSAMRRANERIGDAVHDAQMRMRRGSTHAAILNLSPSSIAARTGGVAVQLMTRLRAEAAMRDIALLHPGGLQFAHHSRRATTIREALAITGAKTVHFEGTSELDLADAVRLREEGIDVVVSVHDFSLFTKPHLLARRLLTAATGVIFPSQFLYDQHRDWGGGLQATGSWDVIEPAVPGERVQGGGNAVAFAGSVRTHKGGHLLAEIARDIPLHVFGGGDANILRPLRRNRNVAIHGYYRAGTLPSLLAKHRVGLVVLPSIVPESYSITLTEAWLADARVAAFDLGAIAERIRSQGGGWVAPPESGAAGIRDLVERWRAGALQAEVPEVRTSGETAARQHMRLYEQCRLLV